MHRVCFSVPGRTRGQGRPRFGRGGHAYKDKRDRDWEDHIAECYRGACPVEDGATTFGDRLLSVAIEVYPALPKAKAKKVFAEWVAIKPDVDNCAKSFLDALNGVAYDDDSQVIHLVVFKHPREEREPYATVEITDLGEQHETLRD